MSAQFTWKVDTTKLDQLLKTIPNNRDRIVKEIAYHVLGQAQKLAPFDTGALRSNANALTKSEGTWSVEFYQEYAVYVELGTWKMPARPFLGTAVELETIRFQDKIKRELIK